jgi:2-oxo-4-hydroxy-4-carboxy-5-ureidoimidazoline decarboxylase
MNLEQLNAAGEQEAVAAFLRCCGSTAWARQMASSRPFATLESMLERSDRLWSTLSGDDWREAFSAHPRIGGGRAAASGDTQSAAWSAQEQSGAAGAPADVAGRLAAGNREYEARFGYIFIICATGRSAAEMLDVLERRLGHDADEELSIAAEEQRRITRLRLAKLVESQ